MESQEQIDQKLKDVHVPCIKMNRRHVKVKQALISVLENKKQANNIGFNLEIMKFKFVAPVVIIAFVAVVFVSGLVPGFGNVASQAKAQTILNDAKLAVTQVSEDIQQDLEKLVGSDNLVQFLDEAYTSRSLEYIGDVTVDMGDDTHDKADALLEVAKQEIDRIGDFSPVIDYDQTILGTKIDHNSSIDFSEAHLLGYTNHDNLAVVLAINQDNLPVFKLILMQN
jgi:hypothetical protein